MISVCVVTLDRLKDYFDIFVESMQSKTKHVKEVLVVNADRKASYQEEWTTGDIKFRVWGGAHDLFDMDGNAASKCAQHAYGLHQAEEQATQEYIWFSDPDIWLYDYVDELYLQLMEKYSLNYIGISRPQATCNAQGFFPGIMNIMSRRKDLPPADFPGDFKSWSRLTSKYPDYDVRLGKHYIYQDSPDHMRSEYPNVDGHTETGCNICLWCKRNNMKWLAFQTLDTHNYSTAYCRGNIKIDKMKPRRLLYHASNAATSNPIKDFTDAYRAFLAEGLE